MDTKNIERYAPQARRDFIQAVTDRAAAIGIRVDRGDVILSDIIVQGDVAFVEGRPFPKALERQRKGIEDRIKQDGFDRTIEAVAYTWFNRFIALRYMELHGYLDHGHRVLSHPAGEATPEILQHAEQLDLPGLNRQEIIELKLDGTRDEELYRKLLVAQCNDLHRTMPFLFERVNDATELLLPDN
ncbi:MAG: SAM-dependent methyltransferase, partial [Candidatus Poribacteria bacterium]